MRRRAYAGLALVLAASACGGGSKGAHSTPGGSHGPSTTEFFEPVPDPSALQAEIDALLKEYEPLVAPATRSSVEAWANSFLAPAAAGDPTDQADAYLVVGEAAFMAGSESGATWAFLRAASLKIDNPAALSQLGFVLNYQERWDDARPFLLFANSLSTAPHTVLVNLAYNYEHVGDARRCVYYLERATFLQPDNGHILHRLAECYFEAGRDLAGNDALDAAQRLAPYDDDIAATAANPPAPFPPTPDDNPGSSNAEDAGKLLTAVNACSTQHLTDVGTYLGPIIGVGGTIDQTEYTFNDEESQHNSTATQCDIQCQQDNPPGGVQDACVAGCYADQCSADLGSFVKFRLAILDARSNYCATAGTVTSGFAGCAWPAYFQLESQAVPFERDSATEMIWTVLDGDRDDVQSVWNDVDDRIVIIRDDVQATCDNASQAINDIDFANPVYFDPFKNLDVQVCSPLLPSMCLKMTNTSVSVSTPISLTSPVNLEFQFDARTGKFNTTVSVPLLSKPAGGVTDAAVNLKLDMQKGLGVQAEAKMGGPLGKTWSSERWLFTD